MCQYSNNVTITCRLLEIIYFFVSYAILWSNLLRSRPFRYLIFEPIAVASSYRWSVPKREGAMEMMSTDLSYRLAYVVPYSIFVSRSVIAPIILSCTSVDLDCSQYVLFCQGRAFSEKRTVSSNLSSYSSLWSKLRTIKHPVLPLQDKSEIRHHDPLEKLLIPISMTVPRLVSQDCIVAFE